MSTPKTYLVTQKICKQIISQVYLIEATSPKEAAKLVRGGGGKFLSEHVQVTGLSTVTGVKKA